MRQIALPLARRGGSAGRKTAASAGRDGGFRVVACCADVTCWRPKAGAGRARGTPPRQRRRAGETTRRPHSPPPMSPTERRNPLKRHHRIWIFRDLLANRRPEDREDAGLRRRERPRQNIGPDQTNFRCKHLCCPLVGNGKFLDMDRLGHR